MRWRRLLLTGICTAGVIVFLIMVTHPNGPHPRQSQVPGTSNQLPVTAKPVVEGDLDVTAPEEEIIPPARRLAVDRTQHPINQLIDQAQHDFSELRERQSQTLQQAVAEYKRRYGVHPPPLFDKWYDFAKKRNVQLIDEYDTIHHSLLPYWGTEPAILRSRVREALSREANGLIALTIRSGKIALLQGGAEWQRNVTRKMISGFVQMLPDMDLAFNIHDEPRVVVPHDELDHLVKVAKTVNMATSMNKPYPRNRFSSRPRDISDGTAFTPTYTLRFNEFAHQPVWTHSRLSCPPDSPARDYHDSAVDNTEPYAFGDLGFIYNHTAFTDVCFTPSLRTSHGFFDRPNAFKVTHELIPIFSQSKVSCFNDIIYPSPWYHYGKTVTDQPPETHQPQYDETLDRDWDAKVVKFWWRGTTTGGYSRNGGWRHQHRQQFVTKVKALLPDVTKGKIMANKAWLSSTPYWGESTTQWKKYWDLMNITFTGVGQCDEPDCVAQREFFPLDAPVNSQQAWRYRYLLDIDGNAFSGRYYAFLRSKSMVFKMAVFREWHDEWIMPWVHYVPLSLKGDDYLESVRYFVEEPKGQQQGPEIALQGRGWANKALRNEDLETWMFRLLLEYGRVVDDARESIGYYV